MKPILTVAAGSRLYGTATENSDTDFTTIYIPNGRDILLQLVKPPRKESTSTNKRKNLPTDIDRTYIALHTYAEYLMVGNMQHGLEIMFSHAINMTSVWDELVENKERFVSKQCVSGFNWFKYNLSQFENAKVDTYDTSVTVRKTLHHVVRIGMQVKEFFDTGSISFPLKGDIEFLLGIKSGKTLRQDAIERGKELRAEIESILGRAPLRAEPDRKWIEDFVMRHYREAAMESATTQ